MTREEKTTRIDRKFAQSLDKIKKERKKKHKELISLSDRKLTALITKNKKYQEIEQEIINLTPFDLIKILSKNDNK